MQLVVMDQYYYYEQTQQDDRYAVTQWNEKIPYVQRTTIQDNLLPRGGPIRDPYPLSWK